MERQVSVGERHNSDPDPWIFSLRCFPLLYPGIRNRSVGRVDHDEINAGMRRERREGEAAFLLLRLVRIVRLVQNEQNLFLW